MVDDLPPGCRITDIPGFRPHEQFAARNGICPDCYRKEALCECDWATYYTEDPIGEFKAPSDEEALRKTAALFVYRESDTETGRPFVILREIYNGEDTSEKTN